jgi:GntR family transcriptional regulator/MocR family aminotransferase
MLISLIPNSTAPLYRQVFDAIRLAIVNEELKLHQRLPPSRELAQQLSLSRNTINTAYAQLCAEGYLVARQGSGYFVNAELPEIYLRNRSTATQANSATPSANPPFSKRGRFLARPTRPVPAISNPAFQPGLSDLDQFPFQQWQHCVNHSLKRADRGIFKYSDQGGYQPLKLALQSYLSQSRGVRCDSGLIIIVNGSQAGLDLIARLLIDDGDLIAVEEPGYLGARDGFLAAGARLEAISVDGEGVSVKELQKQRKKIRLIYTTPSYQFPLGVTMSLQRRLDLLEWAAEHKAFVIEDDYDSEFRYRDRPLSCLQGLDGSQRVIYFGTFSKVMFPGLRLGYIVAPPSLADGFAKALRKTGQDAPLQLQAAMAEFIQQGLFTSHIRRMRTLYGEKQRLLVSLIRQHANDWLDIQETAAGMQVPAFFRKTVNVKMLSEQAKAAGQTITPLSNYYLKLPKRDGLYLGYAGVAIDDMRKNVLLLKRLLENTGN